MQKDFATSMMTMARKMASPLTSAPTWMCEAGDGDATRRLLFSYRPLIPVELTERVRARLLPRWPHGDSADIATAAARPTPGLHSPAGVLSKVDRFLLAYAASALTGLQSRGLAGTTVVHISAAGLMDPELPIYVFSQFQRHGVGMVGVTVTLSPRRPAAALRRRYAS